MDYLHRLVQRDQMKQILQFCKNYLEVHLGKLYFLELFLLKNKEHLRNKNKS